MYKDSALSRPRKRNPTPTSDGYYFSEDNDVGGEIPANKKGKESQPIVKNKKNKKEKKKK